jgi:hypothetical protein
VVVVGAAVLVGAVVDPPRMAVQKADDGTPPVSGTTKKEDEDDDARGQSDDLADHSTLAGLNHFIMLIVQVHNDDVASQQLPDQGIIGCPTESYDLESESARANQSAHRVRAPCKLSHHQSRERLEDMIWNKEKHRTRPSDENGAL